MVASLLLVIVIGLNWTPGVAPAGETPQSALARIGGSVYRDYNSPWSGDGDRARIRLVRYGMVWQTPTSYQVGSTWQLGNEINLLEQDNAARTFEAAGVFAAWYRGMVTQIKSFDSQAKIIGPSVWNWNGAGSNCCVNGGDSYNWFVQQHQTMFGSLPVMDAIAVQIYPWNDTYWNDPNVAVQMGLYQVDSARRWSSGRWPIAVTEWGMLRKPFHSCTVNPNQTEQERYQYTYSMLNGMKLRGVVMAIYYGSHEQVPCDGNGWMSWAINGDGSLTVEGRAHRDVFAPPIPITITPTAVNRRMPPTPVVR